MFPDYNNKKLLSLLLTCNANRLNPLNDMGQWPSSYQTSLNNSYNKKPESYYKQFKVNSNDDILSRSEL